MRRRGRMHEVRFKAGESGESYRVTRTHAWHAKRCDDDAMGAGMSGDFFVV